MNREISFAKVSTLYVALVVSRFIAYGTFIMLLKRLKSALHHLNFLKPNLILVVQRLRF